MNKVGARWILIAYLGVFVFEAVRALAAGGDSRPVIGVVAVGLLIWLLLVCLMWFGSSLAWLLLIAGTALAILDVWFLTPSGGTVDVVTLGGYVAELLLLLTPQLRSRCLIHQYRNSA